MQPTVNIEEIKKYNASLREYRDRANQLKAEIDFNKKELERKCASLSNDLGIQVTPDNIEQVLQERIEKINNTMSIGSEILKRIATEEQAAAVQQSVPQTNIQQTAYTQNAQPMAQAAPQAGSTGQQIPQAPNIPDFSGGLPPIFANR